MKTSMQSTNKSRPPVPSSIDVCDIGGGSGPLRLHTGGESLGQEEPPHKGRTTEDYNIQEHY